MAFEVDWLEREERYRRRVVRLLAISIVLVGAGIGVVAYLNARRERAASAAAAEAAEAARVAKEQRQRDGFVAESTAVAGRLESFLQDHAAEWVPATPILSVPLPRGETMQAFVAKLWDEYARVKSPSVGPEQAQLWAKLHYVDVLNNGPLRPRAVLLPALDQQADSLVLVKPSFPQIVAAQVHVGMREAAPEEPSFLPEDTPAPEGDAPQAPGAADTTPAAPATPAAADTTSGR